MLPTENDFRDHRAVFKFDFVECIANAILQVRLDLNVDEDEHVVVRYGFRIAPRPAPVQDHSRVRSDTTAAERGFGQGADGYEKEACWYCVPPN